MLGPEGKMKLYILGQPVEIFGGRHGKGLSQDEVAALIRARKTLKARGLARDADVKTICEAAGISRRTGYQWASKLESAAKQNDVEHSLRQEIDRLKAEHAELEKRSMMYVLSMRAERLPGRFTA